MSWCPFAIHKDIPPGVNDPAITPRIAVIHTMVGTMEGTDALFRSGTGTEAHFGVAMDGRIWQWRDTAREADAQAGGNPYCISVETEDKGDPTRPWPYVQLTSLFELFTWIGETHNIPYRLVAATSERGLGYHRQFLAWNPNAHSCPGDVRLDQFTQDLIPALQEGDMGLTYEQTKQALTEALHEAASDNSHEFGITGDRVKFLRDNGLLRSDIDTIAQAVVEKLPSSLGGNLLSHDDVKLAVKEALREGSGIVG